MNALSVLILFFMWALIFSEIVNAQSIVTVDPNKVIGTNNMSVAMKLDHYWKKWRDNSTLRQFAKNVGFKFVNSYTIKIDSPLACTSWNNTKKDCNNWNWADIDLLAQRIIEIGAEPFFSLNLYNMSSINRRMEMRLNSTTGLPEISQFAAYTAAWVNHFNTVKIPVRYYEINEEGFEYFGWNANQGLTKLQYYLDVWNAAARAMRATNSSVKLGDDSITMPGVFNYWLTHGSDVDFLSFHKYDSYSNSTSSSGYETDASLLRLAETRAYDDSGAFYGVDRVRQQWLSQRGKLLQVINHETNLDSQWSPGSDPRIRKILGAVWNAMMLRRSVLEGLESVFYYSFDTGYTSNYFGMLYENTYTKYFPYYVYSWFGSNLTYGDQLVNSTSPPFTRTLAWKHQDSLYILIIHNSTTTRNVSLQGITGQFTFSKLEDPTNSDYNKPTTKTGTVNAGENITLNGYTVMILQQYLGGQPISQNKIYGQLKNRFGNSLEANIIAYLPGSNTFIASNNTNSQGNYTLYLPEGIYDIQFNFTSYYIKKLAVSVTSDICDIIKNITSEEAILSFSSDFIGEVNFHVYNTKTVGNVIKNGLSLTKVSSPSQLTTNTWFYNSTEGKVYMIVST